MKNTKKILALLIAALMIVVTVSAIAAGEPVAAVEKDTSITITGLDVGDTVNLYKVLKWVDGTGWALETGFESLSSNASIAKLLDPNYDAKTNGPVELSKDDLEAIATCAKDNATSISADVTTAETYTKDVAEGMYLALIQPKNADVVYNPIIVSADFTKGGTNEIDASSAVMGKSSVAKKEKVFVEKEEEEITLNAGQINTFTVTTVIPAYSKSYVNPSFTITDTLQKGLEFIVDGEHPFTVSSGDVDYTVSPATTALTGKTTFTITFDSEDIANQVTPTNVTLTYSVKLVDLCAANITYLHNDVQVEFDNNPNDDDSHGHVGDDTIEYSFSIDGTLFKHSDYQTGEIVKVGMDASGNITESYRELSNGSEHAALKGAVFGLYLTENDAKNDTNRYTNAVFTGTVTSDENGLMEINGLKGGPKDAPAVYYMKEISAPSGYIKDPNVHVIEVTYDTKKQHVVTTAEDGCPIEYDMDVLDWYTITVDGTESSYTMDHSGPHISEVTHRDNTSEFVNTKGLELPSTGGIGTTLFYAGGTILVLAAAILLVTKRRMAANA